MAWTDPEAGKAFFETGDVPTEANFDTYIFDNLLSLAHPIDVTTSDLDIATTAVETTVYSVTIPANSLGNNGIACMRLDGDMLYNNNVGDASRLRFKFGGTTVIDSSNTALAISLSATRRPWQIEVSLANRGSASAQLMVARFATMQTLNATTGIGAFFGAVSTQENSGTIQNTAAIDTTVNQTLLVSVQWSTSSANNAFRRRWASTILGRN